MNGFHVIKYPSGRYGFVGNVPAALAYEGSAEDLATAKQCGPGLARKIAEREGRAFRSLSWDSEAEAIAAAAAAGYPVAS